MPADTPRLDARTYEEFKRDLQLLIPRYTPEWTDWNESDPGTTLLELFAWLADSVVYRINQVPDALYLKLLELIGIRPAPALPAVVHLTFTPNPVSTADPIVVPAGTVVSADGADGRPVYFETDAGLDVTRFPLAASQVFDGTTHLVTGPFAPLGSSPAAGNAVYLGFGPADPAITRPAFPPQLRLRVTTAGARGAARSDEAAVRPAPPVALQWEYLDRTEPAQRWVRLELFDDASVAFTRSGDVVLEAPPATAVAFGLGAVAEPHFWLRCRLVGGVYPDGDAPFVDAIEANTVAATAMRTVRDEPVGSSSGRPDQEMSLANTLVAPDTAALTVVTGSQAPALWARREDLFTSGPADTHYVLDGAAGVIRFGDGARGAVPPAGSDVSASYRFGGGARGNVAVQAASGLLGAVAGVASVANVRPAVGGQDAQPVDDLTRRAPSMLRAQERAVTAADLTAAALRVGGVGRATALALAHPDLPGVEVPGAVTVVVVPTAETALGLRLPQPGPELKQAVARHLDPLRPVGAEVYVDGPVYREVQVTARIEIRPAASPGAAGLAVRAALRAFLSPLAVPGPDGTISVPRDFGEDFHPTSLYRAILDAPDVVAVPRLRISVDGAEVATADPVPLRPRELLAEAPGHELVVVPRRDVSAGLS